VKARAQAHGDDGVDAAQLPVAFVVNSGDVLEVRAKLRRLLANGGNLGLGLSLPGVRLVSVSARLYFGRARRRPPSALAPDASTYWLSSIECVLSAKLRGEKCPPYPGADGGFGGGDPAVGLGRGGEGLHLVEPRGPAQEHADVAEPGGHGVVQPGKDVANV
jgi:hypothetical protein